MVRGTSTPSAAAAAGRSSSHRLFKDKAKTRVDDLQSLFVDLKLARQESRDGDVALIEEQVNLALKEWQAELNDPTPTNSISSCDFTSELRRLLCKEYVSPVNVAEEQDDATSRLVEVAPIFVKEMEEVHEQVGNGFLDEEYYLNQELSENVFQHFDQYQSPLPTEAECFSMNYPGGAADTVYQQLKSNEEMLVYQQLKSNEEMLSDQHIDCNTSGQNGGIGVSCISDLSQTISPPATAFSRPRCALWDCGRPTPETSGTGWYDYCSDWHAGVASRDGVNSKSPVLCPGGIDLKDIPLFLALTAKIQNKNVGIPECVGAATKQCPWNAHDIFDLRLGETETVREWLFFDQPRRAFESGRRKQRQLADYKGRGWHESRKQVVKEAGGSKRSYYMDPQPCNKSEWHLYEYEVEDSKVWALYRLEYKLVTSKKSGKAKMKSDPVVDLQQQMGRLNAENSLDNNGT